jgi:hypothetical protein
MTRRHLKIRILVIFTILSVAMLGGHFPTAPAGSQINSPLGPVNAPSSTNATVYITPSNVTDTSRTSGQVTFSVYAEDIPAINLYLVSLQYNRDEIRLYSVNSTGNIMGDTAQIVYYCVDGLNQVNPTGQCLTVNGSPIDQPDVITYSQNLLGGSSAPSLNGFLFNLTFNIIGQGLSPLHVYYLSLDNGSTELNASSRDAYFSNGMCGGVACRPPLVNVTIAPSTFSVGSPGNFNATVLLRNPSDSVTSYTWSWGETTGLSQEYSVTHVPHASHVYQNVGEHLASLQIIDAYGIYWYVTLRIHVTRLYVDLYVGEIKVNPQLKVVAGTIVTIHAVINNNSTLPENTNFSITIEHKTVLKTSPSVSLAPGGGQASLDTVWNTSGYTPRMYGVVVIIPPIPQENTTAGNIGVLYVQLIYPLPGGLLSLSILQTAGLSILIIVAVAVALSRFLKKPSYESEAL